MLRPRAAYLPMACVPCPRVTSGASIPTGNTVARSREDAPAHLYGTRCDVAAVLRRRTAARVRLERSELISIARAAIPSHPAVRGPAHADGLLVGDEKRERRQFVGERLGRLRRACRRVRVFRTKSIDHTRRPVTRRALTAARIDLLRGAARLYPHDFEHLLDPRRKRQRRRSHHTCVVARVLPRIVGAKRLKRMPPRATNACASSSPYLCPRSRR